MCFSEYLDNYKSFGICENFNFPEYLLEKDIIRWVIDKGSGVEKSKKKKSVAKDGSDMAVGTSG